MAEPTINDLDPATVAQNEAFLVTFLQEAFPSMDLTEGRVLRNLLVRPAAQLYTLRKTDISNLQDSMSIIAIEQNPALADPSYVDAVLSNYRITRNPGAKATGQVTLVIQNLLTTSVPQGTVFTANGLTYVTTATFVGVTTAAAVSNSNQRLIVKRADGLFAFTVPVVASDVGSNYNAKRSTRFTLDPAPAGIVDAFATADFSAGLNAESNQDLINRFKLALSPQVFAGRANIESRLKNDFPAISAVSIIGFGDEEMIRDRHNLFEISMGGKADIYARTAAVPVSVTLQKQATLVDKTKQLWQLTLLRDDAPGFYTVDSVLLPNMTSDQGSFEITSDVRGLDLRQDTDEFVPAVANLIEGAYSRYQTGVIQFIDEVSDYTNLNNGDTQTYQVAVTAMPNIKDLQQLSVDRGNRNPQADYLVRAPVPAFATVNMKVLYADGADVPDVDLIKRTVSDRVNALNFILGRLPASVIFKAVHDVIDTSATMVQAPLDLLVRIRKPDGEVITARGPNEIDVPELPMEGVTSRTTVFYMGVDDVSVEVEKVPVLPV